MGKSHASGVLWQEDTQLCEPLCTRQMAISARSGPPELLLSPPESSLQPVLEWRFAFTWPRFTPKVCFPNEVAGHTHVDTISKQHTNCASWEARMAGASRWAGGNLGAGSRAAWLETQESRKEQHPSAQTQIFVCEKWLVKRMWNRRAFGMVSVRRK